MSEEILENLCNKIVDVIRETDPILNFFVKASQAKNGKIYLIVRKKRDRFVGDGLAEYKWQFLIFFVLMMRC